MLRVVVQSGHRLVREGVAMVLTDEPDLAVVGTVPDGETLEQVCAERQPDVVILELNPAGWDACRLVALLRKRRRTLIVIAIGTADATGEQRARRSGVSAVVGPDAPVDLLVQAVRASSVRAPVQRMPMPTAPLVTGTGDSQTLTARQLAVLRLVGAGHTSRQIGDRLGISAKTVENHKRQLFRRLGVQNQSHAVAVAMRRGLLGPGIGTAESTVA